MRVVKVEGILTFPDEEPFEPDHIKADFEEVGMTNVKLTLMREHPSPNDPVYCPRHPNTVIVSELNGRFYCPICDRS
jgi:hypothetical protein